MKAIAVSIVVGCFLFYAINALKLSKCDFKSDYKCEVMHGIGIVIPPSAVITAWFGVDE